MIKAALWALLISLFPLLIAPATAQMCGGGEMDGLVGYWNFDEGSGSTAHDASGNGLDGTITGASWISGHVGSGALSFDGHGSTDHVSAPAPFATEPDGFTMSAWFRPEGWGENQSGVIAELYVGTSTRAHIRMLNGSGEQGLRAFVRLTGNPDISIDAPGVPVTFGTWHHVALVVENDRSESRFYLNGVEIGQASDASATNTMVSGAQTLIGRGNLANRHFDGAIDEVMIFDYALSTSEVQKLMVPGEAGDMLYNPDHGTIQWCDGEQWIGLPKPEDASGWSMLASRRYHVCGVRGIDQSAWCWGDGGHGRLGNGVTGGDHPLPQPVLGGYSWAFIATGLEHTCGIQTDGSLWCWGANGTGRLGIGNTNWSTHNTPQSVVESGPWRMVSSEYYHSCGVKLDGSAWCWGSNGNGRLGDDSTTDRGSPVEVHGDDEWLMVSAGGSHSCGVKVDGSAWCWGRGENGRLGNNDTGDQHTPVEVLESGPWISVSAGNNYSCGLKQDGTLWCWGSNFHGRLGIDVWEGPDQLTPQEVSDSGPWASLEHDSANNNTCAIKTDGSAWCWGSGCWSSLGTGFEGCNHETAPTEIILEGPWQAMSSGAHHRCGLRADGTAWCWGHNHVGQIGSGEVGGVAQTPAAPVFEVACENPDGEAGDMLYNADHEVIQWCDGEQWIGVPKSGEPQGWQAVSSHSVHSCGLRIDNTAWCWGRGDDGQLGNGSTSNQPEAVAVAGNDQWLMVNVGNGHSCGIKTDGSAWCWGRGDYGQLGNGSTTSRSEPVEVIGDHQWLMISAGSDTTCGIRSDNSAWCWGRGDSGRLGNGTESNHSTPVEVAGSAEWLWISAGLRTACGVQADNSAWCWGQGNYGKLGNGGVESQLLPVEVVGDDQWLIVNTGASTTCGVQVDNSAWCWGRNHQGQLGIGSHDGGDHPVPLAVVGDDDWISVDTRSRSTCGIKADNTAWCWGYNSYGQLGQGPSFSSPRSSVPREIVGEDQWSAIKVGASSTCGVKSDNTAWCWGRGDSGRLGNGDDSSHHNVPQMVIESAGSSRCDGVDDEAGDLLYNIDHAVIQWCDGTQWIGFPKP